MSSKELSEGYLDIHGVDEGVMASEEDWGDFSGGITGP